MNVYAAQVNLYALLILIIISISRKRDDRSHPHHSKWFGYLIRVTMAMLILDMFAVLIDGHAQFIAIVLNYLLNAAMFILAPFIALFWYLHVVYFIKRRHLQNPWIIALVLTPLIVNAILALISFVAPSLFFVDATGHYSRGPFFNIYVAIMYLYLLIATIEVVVYKRELRKNEYYPMLFFILPPAIGGILQILFYGLLLTWPMVVISVLMVFVLVQVEKVSTDYLTGVFNRRAFDHHIISIERNKNSLKQLGGLVLDLDNFKSINDTHGHQIGDQVLIETAKALIAAFNRNDMIARIGGDEFAVLFYTAPDETIEDAMEKIETNLANLNHKQLFPFEIIYSMGIDSFNADAHESLLDFIDYLDDLMYHTKKQKT